MFKACAWSDPGNMPGMPDAMVTAGPALFVMAAKAAKAANS